MSGKNYSLTSRVSTLTPVEGFVNSTNSNFLEQLQTFSEATLSISSQLDLDVALQTIVDTARQFVKAKYAALDIVNCEGSITSFVTSGIPSEVRELIGESPCGHGVLGVIIKQGRSLRVRDLTKDSRHEGFPPHHPVMTSFLGVPISLQGSIIGNLYLSDKIGAAEFSLEDEWWLTLLARQAAVAIQNANLYQKLWQAQQQAQTLSELTIMLNQAALPTELFDRVTEAACRLLGLPAAALYLLNPQHTNFNLISQKGMQLNSADDSCDSANTYLPVDGSIAGKVLFSEKSVAVADTTTLTKTYFPKLATNQLPKALLVVPIQQQEHPLQGVLEVYATQPRIFREEEIILLETFATQAALILERTQLLQQKEEFLSMTAHDLRAPLTAIKMCAGLLESSLPIDLPQPLLRLVSNINQNSERLSHLLEDLLDLSRLEQGRLQLNLTETDLGGQVTHIAQTLAPLFENKGQQLELQIPGEELLARIDKHRFEQIVVNLLTNANKYTPTGGAIQLGVAIELNWLTVSVCDNGPGIPDEEQERIFDRFYRRPFHEQNSETLGSGLGLPIARLLAELHGGKLWVESREGRGSSFFLKLPTSTYTS